jgi:hypothetical protein
MPFSAPSPALISKPTSKPITKQDPALSKYKLPNPRRQTSTKHKIYENIPEKSDTSITDALSTSDIYMSK